MDFYAMINHACCNNPKLQLIWEKSMGYQPFVCCITCMHQTHFEVDGE
jgi:hypothetical protein